MSLVRSPEDGGTFEFSARGLAELASDCTDTLMVLDDTENVDDPAELVKALKRVVHTIPGGRSKIISRGVDQSKFPQLRWSTLGFRAARNRLPRWRRRPDGSSRGATRSGFLTSRSLGPTKAAFLIDFRVRRQIVRKNPSSSSPK